MDLFLKSNALDIWSEGSEPEGTIDDELFIHAIKGGCAGVAIYKRGYDDPHLMVKMLVEDDDSWFINEGGFSSAWLADIRNVWERVNEWLNVNADPDVFKGITYGWRLKQ